MRPVRSAREVGQSEISLISRHGKPQHGPEPAEYTALSLSQSVAQSLPQGTAHKTSAWDLPHQLRRLIAGAVLAFGFNQGLFLRRQRPLRVLAPCHTLSRLTYTQCHKLQACTCTYALIGLQDYSVSRSYRAHHSSSHQQPTIKQGPTILTVKKRMRFGSCLNPGACLNHLA